MGMPMSMFSSGLFRYVPPFLSAYLLLGGFGLLAVASPLWAVASLPILAGIWTWQRVYKDSSTPAKTLASSSATQIAAVEEKWSYCLGRYLAGLPILRQQLNQITDRIEQLSGRLDTQPDTLGQPDLNQHIAHIVDALVEMEYGLVAELGQQTEQARAHEEISWAERLELRFVMDAEPSQPNQNNSDRTDPPQDAIRLL